MITVTAAIIQKDGLFLAARRKKEQHMGGYWEFPGGKIEENETPEQCLLRELKEEFGIDCTIDSFFGESIFEYSTKKIRLLAFFVLSSADEFHCYVHDEICWLPVKELSSLNWAPADLPFVKKLEAIYG